MFTSDFVTDGVHHPWLTLKLMINQLTVPSHWLMLSVALDVIALFTNEWKNYWKVQIKTYD